MQMPKITERKMQKKCNFQRCIFSIAFFLQLATLHFLGCIFFATLINVCIFLTKKITKNMQKNATAPKQMQPKMRKKLQLPTFHFLSCIFFATCDVAFS